MREITKTPGDARLDYIFSWDDWLAEGGDSIASYEITAADGLTVESHQKIGSTKVRAWISGGQEGRNYDVVCEITTDSSPARIDERTIRLKVRRR